MNRNIINWINQSIKITKPKHIKIQVNKMKQEYNEFKPQNYQFQSSIKNSSQRNNSNLSTVQSYNFQSKKQFLNKRKLSFEESFEVIQKKLDEETIKNRNFSNHTNNAIMTLNKIRQYRKTHIAPVDVVGCEKLHNQHQPIQIQKYQTLIALILSVQTKDETTGKVMQRLKNYGLKPNIMSQIQQQKLVQMIRESNFNKKKTKNIIEVSRQIQQNGLPSSMEQLMKYPGVGMKIATLYMRTAEKVIQGIGVDTHVHRIANRLGWVKNTKNPVQTEQKLQKVFPKDQWHDININLVGLGQLICGAKKPLCSQCPISKQCPSKLFIDQF